MHPAMCETSYGTSTCNLDVIDVVKTSTVNIINRQKHRVLTDRPK